jgi:putative ABC transport system permease protein
MWDAVTLDLRTALRGLRRSLLVSSLTVVTLSLGIGVVTALFAVVDAVVLRPIATDQERLVRIWGHDAARGMAQHAISYSQIEAWAQGSRTLEGVAALLYADKSSIAFTIDNQSTPVEITPVSVDFFDVLHGGPPLLGRWFDARDKPKSADRVAIASERFWRRITGGDPGFVGRRLERAGGGVSVLIVGVAPATLDYPLGTDLWMPLASFYDSMSAPKFDAENPLFAQFHAIGRLRRGASPEQLQAEIAVLHRQWIADVPSARESRMRETQIVVQPLLNALLGDTRLVLLFLFGAAGLVFAIAGVNVAALLLMRASTRRRELAVRVALGASQSRLTGQVLVESLVLGLVGGLGGLVVAHLFLAVLQRFAPGDMPRIEETAINIKVLGFCASAALVWVVTFGTAPSWNRRKFASPAGLGSGQLSVRGGHAAAALRVFTVAEIASAVIVAIAAGLLIRSFGQLQAINRGYDASRMAVFRLLLPDARYPDPRARLAYYEDLASRVGSIPGVAAVSPVHLEPGTGTTGLSAGLRIEGQTEEEARSNPWSTWEPVIPSYFATLGIPITKGRAFTSADRDKSMPVVIVSEAVAQRYWPGQDPIGKRLKFIRDFDWATVVGVAADTRYRELTRAWLTVYFPAPQFFFFSPGWLVVRTSTDPEALVPAIRQTIRSADSGVAIRSIASMGELAGKELARPRAALMVASLFALMAIILAAVGVYGVMSYEVSQRRRELAVRSAIGATPRALFRGVVLRSAAIGIVGIAIGLGAAALATRSLRAVLFEISPADPGSFLAGAAALLAIVLLAAYMPARRAATADPVAILRTE